MRIVVGGALANKPGYGGEAWVRLAWVRGLRALGAEVLFVEELAPLEGGTARHIRFFDAVCSRWGLEGSAALLSKEGEPLSGLPREAVLDFGAGADLLVNLSGHLRWGRLMSAIRRRAYVDLDPGYTQLWYAGGDLSLGLERHHIHFTVGENIGSRACPIPTGAVPWLPVRQPVVLEDWPDAGTPLRPRFTTVASWRGAYGPVEFRGRRYGLKAHEFRRIMDLPARLPFPAEIALDIHHGDAADRSRLLAAGWRLELPSVVANTPDAFRDYVSGSAAELSVAQGIYVDTRCGWFSDRSARYLASGRPVVVQDTGFGRRLPVGEGLLAFRTPDEAAEAAHEVAREYERHRKAARRLAEEFFDARTVLRPFLERGLDGTRRGRPATVRRREPDPPLEVGVATGSRGSTAAASLGTIVVSGMVAGVPGHGGASWAVLQYVLGLRRLGHDVHLVEEVDPALLRPRGRAFEASANATYFRSVARRYGLDASSTLLLSGTRRTVGLAYPQLARVFDRADVVLNLSGTLVDEALLERPTRRVYVDLDPAFTQLWHEAEGVDVGLRNHTHFTTVGLEVGRPDCPVPTCGVPWIHTLPPVVLDAWPAAHEAPARDAWTTVANWRGYGSVHWQGVAYGQKAHAFRELYPLPPMTRDRFELALAIHPDETADLQALRENRWALLDPGEVAGDPELYRRFVSESAAEMGVAKSGYVASRCGWFSDRSACYLAAGRPVLAQETGFSRHLPTGRGLLSFRTLEEAAEGVAAVRTDYAGHARAAHEVAREHLDSDRVLSRLLTEVGA